MRLPRRLRGFRRDPNFLVKQYQANRVYGDEIPLPDFNYCNARFEYTGNPVWWDLARKYWLIAAKLLIRQNDIKFLALRELEGKNIKS